MAVYVYISAPAYFPQKTKQMQVQKGEQAHLQCTALGDTPIEIMWKIGGKRIGEDMDQRCIILLVQGYDCETSHLTIGVSEIKQLRT